MFLSSCQVTSISVEWFSIIVLHTHRQTGPKAIPSLAGMQDSNTSNSIYGALTLGEITTELYPVLSKLV